MNINGNITKELNITTQSEYLQRKYPDIDFDDEDLDLMYLYEDKENDIAGQIIALQVAVRLAWLTPYLDGSTTDNLRSQLSAKKQEFKAVNGNDYEDYNYPNDAF